MTDVPVKQQENQESNAVERQPRRPTYVPVVDILDSPQSVQLIADMPGIDEESVELDLDRNVLSIKGTFNLEAPEGFRLMYQEYESGDYERSFTLGSEIDRDGIQATVRDGTLRVTLPKAKEAQPRKIEVARG